MARKSDAHLARAVQRLRRQQAANDFAVTYHPFGPRGPSLSVCEGIDEDVAENRAFGLDVSRLAALAARYKRDRAAGDDFCREAARLSLARRRALELAFADDDNFWPGKYMSECYPIWDDDE